MTTGAAGDQGVDVRVPVQEFGKRLDRSHHLPADRQVQRCLQEKATNISWWQSGQRNRPFERLSTWQTSPPCMERARRGISRLSIIRRSLETETTPVPFFAPASQSPSREWEAEKDILLFSEPQAKK
jgi:hypothetical protein